MKDWSPCFYSKLQILGNCSCQMCGVSLSPPFLCFIIISSHGKWFIIYKSKSKGCFSCLSWILLGQSGGRWASGCVVFSCRLWSNHDTAEALIVGVMPGFLLILDVTKLKVSAALWGSWSIASKVLQGSLKIPAKIPSKSIYIVCTSVICTHEWDHWFWH